VTPTITTFTGKRVNPLDLDPDLICIEDIAHALALCNRFAGHTKVPLSVAQHSICVSRLCFFHHALQGLLHDASEAYLGDMTKWVKQTPELEGYRKIEDKIQRVIYTKFGCEALTTPVVDYADKFMVRIEAQWGFDEYAIDHPDYPPPSTEEELHRVEKLHSWPWKIAERKFLVEFAVLTSESRRKKVMTRGEI
jgi:hypothetical protein